MLAQSLNGTFLQKEEVVVQFPPEHAERDVGEMRRIWREETRVAARKKRGMFMAKNQAFGCDVGWMICQDAKASFVLQRKKRVQRRKHARKEKR